MKKILLPLVALFFSATVASAQQVKDGSSFTLSKSNVMVAAPSAQVKKAPAKIAENQKYVGLDGSGVGYRAMGVPDYPQVEIAASYLEASKLAKYDGMKVVGLRFSCFSSLGSNAQALVFEETETGVNEVCAYDVPKQEYAKINEDQTAFIMNWNEVYFDTPYTIDCGKVNGLLYGYSYKQKSEQNGGQYTDACYPLMMGASSDYQNGFFAYGDLEGKGANWYQFNTNGYALNVQLIVESEGGFPKDIAVVGASLKDSWLKAGNALEFAFAVKNSGDLVQTATMSVCVDDKEIAEFNARDVVDETNIVHDKILLPADLAMGIHKFTVKVKSVDGEAPAGDLSDDSYTTSFRIYNNKAERQFNLVEQFTSWECTYCPKGYDVLRALCAKRDDVAWVGIHGDMSSNADPYTIDDGQYILGYSITGFPSANFNRFYVNDPNLNSDGTLGLVIAYNDASQAADLFSSVIDASVEAVPSMVNLGLETNFDAESGNLDITVKGTGVTGAAEILKGATLTIYLTENGLVSRQLNNGKWTSKYNHENVLRQVVTVPWGDEINWNGDNFTANYSVAVDADNYDYASGNTLNCVAFISDPFVVTIGDKLYYNSDTYNVSVNQCVATLINEGETNGVQGVETTSAKVVNRYNVNGAQVSAPVKGVNIVKMSDGTVRKVVRK